MTCKRNLENYIARMSVACLAGLVMLLLATATAIAQTTTPTPATTVHSNIPPFDFSDAFYLSNGLDPTRIVFRISASGTGGGVFDASFPSPQLSQIRETFYTGTFDRNGLINFTSILGVLVNSHSFLTTPIGQNMHSVADSFQAFVFPKQPNLTNVVCNPPGGAAPEPCVTLSPVAPNRRQNTMFDTRATYFCIDLIQVWLAEYVIYTPAAFTAAGQAILRPIAQANGTTFDGTPVLNTLDQIDSLQAQGLVTLGEVPDTVADDGSQGVRYVVCDVMQDPTDGTVTPDGKLVDAKHNDTALTSVTPDFVAEFTCLQQTGNFCPGSPQRVPVPF
ncbi:MAG TPA: hypothetical protein VKY85_15570 [Candidatus Angelobacter sp.]|nr:hypothetical protein [Candidatus Angelobacter sp.]